MSSEKRREIARKGGASVPGEKRSFSQSPGPGRQGRTQGRREFPWRRPAPRRAGHPASKRRGGGSGPVRGLGLLASLLGASSSGWRAASRFRSGRIDLAMPGGSLGPVSAGLACPASGPVTGGGCCVGLAMQPKPPKRAKAPLDRRWPPERVGRTPTVQSGARPARRLDEARSPSDGYVAYGALRGRGSTTKKRGTRTGCGSLLCSGDRGHARVHVPVDSDEFELGRRRSCRCAGRARVRKTASGLRCSELMPARSTAEMCTNTSAPPSSGWMKPKPFWVLNHFTVPICMTRPFPDMGFRRPEWARDQIFGEGLIEC